MIYEFDKQLNDPATQEAERRCYDYLANQGKQVCLTAKNPDFYDIGADIIVQEPDGDKTVIDVKACKFVHTTGNLFYEIVNSFKTKTLGWAFKDTIDQIYYVDVRNWVSYIFNKKELHQYVCDNLQSGTYRIVRNINFDAMGILLPLNKIKHLCKEIQL